MTAEDTGPNLFVLLAKWYATFERYMYLFVAVLALLAAPAAALDYEHMADRILSSLRLQPGERVLIRSDPQYFSDLTKLLTRRIRDSKVLTRNISAGDRITPALLDGIDVCILLPLSQGARALAPDETRALIAWVDTGGNRRELHFHWSDGSRRADGLQGTHTEELDTMYERALNVDYAALNAKQEAIAKVLRLGTVRISTPAGTDLMFRVGKRPVNKQNGDASAARAASANMRVDRHIELPAGVIRVAPVEESISGQIVLPEARFGDTIARKVVLQVDNGRITRIRAEEGFDAVAAMLAKGGDAALQVREFALGLNPYLAQTSGDIIPYYGYGAGVVRISLGDNQELGGNIRGDFVRWFFFPDATAHVDFRYFVRGGKLLE